MTYAVYIFERDGTSAPKLFQPKSSHFTYKHFFPQLLLNIFKFFEVGGKSNKNWFTLIFFKFFQFGAHTNLSAWSEIVILIFNFNSL